MNQAKQIQWFPGHMFKSLREIREKLGLMDMVCILLDARLPLSSMNPEIRKVTKNKPVLILLNKMDLADEQMTHHWLRHYQEEGYAVLALDAQSGKNVSKIKTAAKNLLAGQLAREKAKGLKERPLRTMILGIPNVGKSTLINRLARTKATRTANTPGVTRAQQWIKLGDDFELLDTPGVLWPKFDDPKVGYHLAITGAIKDKVLPEYDVAHYAISFLKTAYPGRLVTRYGLDTETLDPPVLIHAIGKTRGALTKGGDIDEERVYQILLTDIRNKQLGGLTFDRP